MSEGHFSIRLAQLRLQAEKAAARQRLRQAERPVLVVKKCEKRSHPSKAEADIHKGRLIERGETNLNSYFCNFCNSWHVGHSKKPVSP